MGTGEERDQVKATTTVTITANGMETGPAKVVTTTDMVIVLKIMNMGTNPAKATTDMVNGLVMMNVPMMDGRDIEKVKEETTPISTIHTSIPSPAMENGADQESIHAQFTNQIYAQDHNATETKPHGSFSNKTSTPRDSLN